MGKRLEILNSRLNIINLGVYTTQEYNVHTHTHIQSVTVFVQSAIFTLLSLPVLFHHPISLFLPTQISSLILSKYIYPVHNIHLVSTELPPIPIQLPPSPPPDYYYQQLPSFYFLTFTRLVKCSTRPAFSCY